MVPAFKRCICQFGLYESQDLRGPRMFVAMTPRMTGMLLLVSVVSVAFAACASTASRKADAPSAGRATPSRSTNVSTSLTMLPPRLSPVGSPPTEFGAEGSEVIGTSVQGRPIRSLTLGQGQRKVLFVGGIHGDETEGAYTTTQLPIAFTHTALVDSVTLTIVEDTNPDGRAAGTRDNANGVDVNRNFPASNFDGSDPKSGRSPLSQPEARALHDLINRVKPNLVIVMHSWVGRQFVNFDGPASAIAERFAATSGWTVEESNSFAPTPGSLGSFVGRDCGTPILTIEVRKGADPNDVWEKIRQALLDVIGG